MHLFGKLKCGGEFLCVLCTAAAVLLISAAYVRDLEHPFNHPHYSLMTHIYPAVFFAAGHGMITTDIEKIPGLAEFIYSETSAFDTNHIPSDLTGKPMASPIATTHLYFLYAVGWMWRIFGVSTDTLAGYAILLRVLSALFLYGLFRFGLGRLGSIIAVLIVFSSPAMLSETISLRDWGKIPFLFAFFLLMAHLLVSSLSRNRLLVLSALLGAVLGVGMGFRQDLLLCLPLAAGGVLFFTRITFPNGVRWRMAALLLLTTVFGIVSHPIFQAGAEEGNQSAFAHGFLLGLSPPLEGEMEFGNASYDLLPRSVVAESAVYGAVNTYARRQGSTASMENPSSAEYQRHLGDQEVHVFFDPYLFYNGAEYSKQAGALITEIIRRFPADAVARAWRSVVTVFHGPEHYSKETLNNRACHGRWLQAILGFHDIFARHLKYFSLVYIALVLLALSMRRFRLALFCVGILLWFCGYPSIQFVYRYSFHLIFLPVWAVFLGLETVLRLPNRWFRKSPDDGNRFKPVLLAYPALLIGIIVAALVFPLAGLRYWQYKQVSKMADQLSSLPLETVSVTATQQDDKILLAPRTPLPGLADADALPAGETAWEYAALTFDTHGFDIPITLQYDARRSINDLSQTFLLRGLKDGKQGRITFFFPIYEVNTTYGTEMLSDFARTFPTMAPQDARPLIDQDWWRRGKFAGISISQEYLSLFTGFHIVHGMDDFPVLPFLAVPDDRRFLRTCKTGPWEEYVRTQVVQCVGGATETPPDPVDNRCWTLDEPLAHHPPSKIFEKRLLPFESADEYISEWQRRVSYLPELAETAALDLANAGTYWLQEGRLEDAQMTYEAAHRLAPNTALYPLRLGQVLERRNDPQSALECYLRAMRNQPFLPDAADRADALFEKFNDSNARRLFWQELAQAYPDVWFVGMRLGALLEAAEDWEAAAAAYERVHEAHPKHPDTNLALARCWGRIGRPQDAYSLLMETTAIHAHYVALAAYLLTEMGDRFAEAMNYSEAEEAYNIAATLDPENADVLLHLGDMQRQSHKYQSAQSTYISALKHVGDHNESLRSLLRERLNSLDALVSPSAP